MSVTDTLQETYARPDVQTELRRTLADQSSSSVQKYARLTVGRSGLPALLNYELRTSLFGFIPGAAGLVLRRFAYRRLFQRCGRGVVIGRNVTIRHPHRIALGNRVVIDDNVVLDGKGDCETAIDIGDDAIVGRNSILSCKGGAITIGRASNISVNCTLISETRLSVGNKVLIAGHCYLIAGGNHGLERLDVPIMEQPCSQRGGIAICDNAWLGAGVIVLDGVRIGDDTAVAAGAVVTRELPAATIAAGVPARIIRHRKNSP